MKSYDASAIVDALEIGKIVYGRGSIEDREVGHAWVYDGYCKAQKSGTTKILLHCNWGWNGQSNGYYISGIFDTANGPEFKDTTDNTYDNPTAPTLKESLQYSIISK